MTLLKRVAKVEFGFQILNLPFIIIIFSGYDSSIGI